MADINKERSQSLALDIVQNFQECEGSGFQRKMEKRCIYKCPYGLNTIKNLKGKHIPHMVSLGPYHHGEEHLRGMEFHKRRALHAMIMESHKSRELQGMITKAHTAPRSPREAQQQLMHSLLPFIECLSEVEQELRDCYGRLDPKWSSSKAFLEMMLIDGCFILKVLRCTEARGNSNSGLDGMTSNPIFTSDPIIGPNVSSYIRAIFPRDMLMLENQIPLLVLERLLHIENNGSHQRCSTSRYTYLNQLIINFLDFKFSERPHLGSRRSLHVLDVYRECLIRSPTPVPNQNPNPSTRESCDATCCQAVAPRGDNGPAEGTGTHNEAGYHGNSNTSLDNIGVPCAHTIKMGSQGQMRTSQLPDQSPGRSQDNIVVDSTRSVGTQIGGGNPQGQDCRVLSSQMSIGVPCVKRLSLAGVTFRRSQGGWLSDVSFDERNGVLSLPFLEIDDDTAAKFMSLIAFEQVHPRAEGQVTSYFAFMDALLDTGEDVNILISKGIVRNELGSDDAAAKLFNSLGDGVDVQNDRVLHADEGESVRRRITDVRKKLNAYASSNWNMCIADLKHKYCNSPWACMSVLAAIFLIFLTTLQTVYAIWGFHEG